MTTIRNILLIVVLAVSTVGCTTNGGMGAPFVPASEMPRGTQTIGTDLFGVRLLSPQDGALVRSVREEQSRQRPARQIHQSQYRQRYHKPQPRYHQPRQRYHQRQRAEGQWRCRDRYSSRSSSRTSPRRLGHALSRGYRQHERGGGLDSFIGSGSLVGEALSVVIPDKNTNMYTNCGRQYRLPR